MPSVDQVRKIHPHSEMCRRTGHRGTAASMPASERRRFRLCGRLGVARRRLLLAGTGDCTSKHTSSRGGEARGCWPAASLHPPWVQMNVTVPGAKTDRLVKLANSPKFQPSHSNFARNTQRSFDQKQICLLKFGRKRLDQLQSSEFSIHRNPSEGEFCVWNSHDRASEKTLKKKDRAITLHLIWPK